VTQPTRFPSGTVTLLFTDIQGSTRLWEAEPEQMAAALRRHDEILRAAIEGTGGYVFKTVGDAFRRRWRPRGSMPSDRSRWPGTSATGTPRRAR
jgi:class 3 adenylate cyclase